MASTIRIKRSGVSGNPSTLAQGELAYSYFNGAGGDRLYVGTGTETLGDAANHQVIGGKYYVDLLGGEGNAPFGTLTANTALIADSDSKLDQLKVDNITLNGNTVSTATGNLTLSPTGDIDANSNKIVNVTDPTSAQDAATKAYVDNITGGESIQLGIAGDTGTDNVALADSDLTIAGGTGLSTAVTNNTVTVNLDDTTVSSGSYGSASQIPTFTVDAQGRLTAASQVSIQTQLSVNNDLIGLDSGFSIVDNGSLNAVYDSATRVFTLSVDDATTSTKGIASFATADFGVSSGAVSLNDAVVKSVSTDGAAATPSTHAFTIAGTSLQGISTSGSGSTVTITAADATSSQKGVAKFNTADFSVSSGDVTIKTGGVSNTQLANSAVTVTAGNGLTGGGAVSLGGSTTLNVNVDDATLEVATDTVQVKDGGVTNAKLANSSVKIGSSTISLGDSETDLSGLTSLAVDNVSIDGNSITTTSGALLLDPLGGQGTDGDVYVYGNLFVEGTTTTINSTELSINDLNIVLADSAASAAAANGAGITVNGANATITYASTGDKWTTNKDLDVGGQLFLNGVGFEQLVDSEVANLLVGGEGITLTYNDGANSLTIDGDDATTSTKGIASFSSDNFTVTSGAVTISAIDGGTY